MKVLLDECLPLDLRFRITGHDVFTVTYMGWAGIKNGRLLLLAAGGGFDALVTTDAGVEYQQNLATLPVAVVILDAASNELPELALLVPQLTARLGSLTPRTWIHVP